MLDYISGFFIEFWNISCLMAPWLLFGFLIGGVIAVFVPDSVVRKHLGGKGFMGIVKAALIGVPLPLCSCGVIPVAATLRRQGAGNGTVASFITSTPQIGFSSFVPAWQLLGAPMAIIKAIFAFITGILAGALINWLCPEEDLKETESSNTAEEEESEAPQGNKILAVFKYAFITLMGDVGGTLLFGLVISALIGVFLPADFAAQYASNTFIVVPLMILVSMPMYVCTNAAIPIAVTLLLKGFSPGTAMAFLIAGPSCSAPMITSFWKILGRRAAIIYVVMMVIAILTVCWGMDLLGANFPLMHRDAPHEHGMAWYQIDSAILMLAIMIANWIRPYVRKQRKLTAGPGQIILDIEDMTCEHCLKTVTQTLNSIPGVKLVKPDVPNKQVLVEAEEAQYAPLLEALKNAGFEAKMKGN